MKTQIQIQKKTGEFEDWTPEKIAIAVGKSAARVNEELTQSDLDDIIALVEKRIEETGRDKYTVIEIHQFVEKALRRINPEVAQSYMDYRNYKKDLDGLYEGVWESDQRTRFLGDTENANKDSALVATQQALRRSAISKVFYTRYLARKPWVKAMEAGYIYIHDLSDRIDTMNCCLFRIGEVMKGGFQMANIHYNEPNTLKVAFDVMGDIVLSAAAQQYGGFTMPQIDKVLSRYAEKSYKKYCEDFETVLQKPHDELTREELEREDAYAYSKVKKDFEQGFQGWEYKFNTVGSSRGDYPFITVTLGLSKDRWGRLAQETALKVHAGGQGEEGKRKPVLFPKYVFLYDENIHGEGKEAEYIFDIAIKCSQKTMYPDYLSMSGEGYIASMYKQFGQVISPMGCRAFLSPYYEVGGQTPADEWDEPIYEGRFNVGAVSLNLPLIYLAAKRDDKDFYEVLDYYLQMIREIHQFTYQYLAERPASINPLAFCEGGFYLPGSTDSKGLNPDEKIAPFLDAATASFGITALNELQVAYNGKSIAEDGMFAKEVLEYINKKIGEFKAEDHHMYAIYGTPAESLAEKQAAQIKKMFGIIPGVSDRDFVSNSFHCHVSEDLTPIEKQDKEQKFWELCNGGKIQYVRYKNTYNTKAFKQLIRRAMAMGYYEGVNLFLNYCNDCGNEWLEDTDECPCCHSQNYTSINRMNGYLAYSRVSVKQTDGSYRIYSRLNKGKMAEIAERKSM